jgi:MGT family glycosyltransferase
MACLTLAVVGHGISAGCEEVTVRYLFAVWDGGGTVPPQLGLARRLVERGHDVVVLADPTLEEGVLAVGARFRSWQRAPHRRSASFEDDVVKDWECRTPLQVFDRLLTRLIATPAPDFAEDVLEAVTVERPAACAVDSVLFGAQLAAHSTGLPTAALAVGLTVRPTPGYPPFGAGLAPARGPLGRSRDRALNAVTRRMWDRALPDLQAVCRRYGLPPLASTWEVADRCDRVLQMTSPAFDWPHELPGNAVHVGIAMDDTTWAGQASNLPAGNGPLVLAGFSTAPTRGQQDLARRVVAALDTSGLRAIVTTGPATDPAAVPSTHPDRVLVVRAAPHAALLPHTAAVITHCGHGTTTKAMAAGIPTLCLPLGRDQADNARRVTERHAGLRLRPTASSAAIGRSLRHLLDEPSYAQGARALAQAIARDGTAGRAVSELEALPFRTGSSAVQR